MSGTDGEIIYPETEGNYPTNQNCKWYITTSDDSIIQLSFKYLDIENAPKCFYDALIIYDGFSTSSKSIGRYCGSSKPNNIQSTGNKLLLHFKSDDRQTRKGFALSWKRLKNTDATKGPAGGSLFLTRKYGAMF